MNFLELCNARYSCRDYSERSVEKEKIEYIKECVRLAPSAVNRQPWKFIFIDYSKPEALAAVKACYPRQWIQNVSTIVICCQDRINCWTRKYDNKNHADIDIAIATEHLCLAATEQGLGNCWVCNFDVDLLKNTVEIPEGYDPVALVPLGYANDEPKDKDRKPLSEIWI